MTALARPRGRSGCMRALIAVVARGRWSAWCRSSGRSWSRRASSATPTHRRCCSAWCWCWCWRWCSPRSPTAASTQGAGDARRAVGRERRPATARCRNGRRGNGVLHPGAGRPGVRAGLRVHARLHLAVRLGAAHRGVGPWLPYQMFGCAFVGLVAGLLPRMTGKAEVIMLAVYGSLSGYLFGFLLNLQFWPFSVDPDQLDLLPAGAVVRRTMAPIPGLRRDDVAGLGHRTGGDQLRLHPAGRTGVAGGVPTRRSQGQFRAAGAFHARC